MKNMSATQTKQLINPAIAILLILTAGCSLASHNLHPEYNNRISSIKNPVLLMSDVNMYQITPDGRATRRDDWSALGRKNLQDAITQNLKRRQGNLMPLTKTDRTSQEIEEVIALYKLVHETMDQQIFGASRNISKERGFQYSLGSMETILRRFGADAAIFITGYDKISARGRKSMLDLAIADRSGAILYYSVSGTIKGNDLRDPASAQLMVRSLLSGISGVEG